MYEVWTKKSKEILKNELDSVEKEVMKKIWEKVKKLHPTTPLVLEMGGEECLDVTQDD